MFSLPPACAHPPLNQVLLIHDPTTDKEAAAMDVRVGSMHDPPTMLGLAHFCEHMLFLGSGEGERIRAETLVITQKVCFPRLGLQRISVTFTITLPAGSAVSFLSSFSLHRSVCVTRHVSQFY